MKIPDRKGPSPVNPFLPVPEHSVSGPDKAEDSKPIPQDAVSVNLSESSRSVRAAREKLASIPDIRIEKVAELKDAIEDGTYKVESEKIARRMVDESLKDSVRQKRSKNGKR